MGVRAVFVAVLRSFAVFVLSSTSLFAQAVVSIDCNLTAKPSEAGEAILQRLMGTVELPSGCSASIVTVAGRSSAAKAWVLSAGHCVGMGKAMFGKLPVLAAQEIIHNHPVNSPLTLETGKAAAPRTCLVAEQLLYATLTGADIALYQLNETYEAIEQRTGVKPFVIAEQKEVASGISIETPSAAHRHNQTCLTAGRVVKLREAMWEWNSVLRMSSECKIIGGYSGGPVVRSDTNEVIGVVGTTHFGDGKPCELNNPCEVDDSGVSTVGAKGQPYFHAARQIQDCLDASKNFDLNAVTCPLRKPL